MTSDDATKAESRQIIEDLERKLAESVTQQAATSDILRVISQSPTDVRPVFDAIVLNAVRLFRCDLAFFLRRHGNTFSQAALVGSDGSHIPLDPAALPIDPEINFPSRTIVSRKNLHLPDWSAIELPEHERRIHEAYGINSSLFLPLLLRGGECFGLLALASKRPRIFGKSEISLAESFRDQAVIAIENTRLFNETQESLERQTATADILKVIASSPSDVQPVFEAIAASAKKLIGGFSAVVQRFIGDDIHLAAFTPTNPEADATLQASFPTPISRFPVFLQVRDGKTVEFADTEAEDVPRLNRDLARLRGYRSMLFTPLMNNGAPIGMISVTRKEPGSFADHHVELVRTFADQAVIAIENVRLFDEVKAKTADLSEALQQQTATADVLKVISRSAFDLDLAASTILEAAARLCRASLATLHLRDGDVCWLATQFGMPEAFEREARETPIPVKYPLHSRRTARAGEVAHFADAWFDPDYLYKSSARLGGYRAIVIVPLMREGELAGIFSLGRPEPEPFTESQIKLTQTFADQAAIAIENVRLFEEVRARTKELSASLDELRTAQDRLVQTEKLASLGQLTAGIAHEIKNPLNFVNNFSALSAELIDELDETLAPAPLDQKMRRDVGELTQMLKSNLEKVVQHGKRADSIVKNMLLHSREGSGEQRPADINALLDESLNLAYHGARAEKPEFNITLRRDLDPDAGAIDVFPQEITRAFINLISNGFYAASKRKAENGEADFEPVLSAATKNLGSHVEIRIRDNGTGIPPEMKDKIFNPFFTTKPTGEGTGLGLSMSHDIIVKQHGGRIEVDTQPGQFTEFTVILPRTTNLVNNRKN